MTAATCTSSLSTTASRSTAGCCATTPGAISVPPRAGRPTTRGAPTAWRPSATRARSTTDGTCTSCHSERGRGSIPGCYGTTRRAPSEAPPAGRLTTLPAPTVFWRRGTWEPNTTAGTSTLCPTAATTTCFTPASCATTPGKGSRTNRAGWPSKPPTWMA